MNSPTDEPLLIPETLEELKQASEQHTAVWNELYFGPAPDKSLEKETQSSNRFRDMVTAWHYYRPYNEDWESVKQKVTAGEIELGYHPDVVSWNDEGRAMILTPRAKQQRAEHAAHCAAVRSAAIVMQHFDAFYAARQRAEIIMRKRSAGGVSVSGANNRATTDIKAKAGLERALEPLFAEWEEPLPYCFYGKPYYSIKNFDEAEEKPANSRAIRIRWHGNDYIITRQRKVCNHPVSTNWGMGDLPAVVMVFAMPGKRLVNREVLRLGSKEVVALLLRAAGVEKKPRALKLCAATRDGECDHAQCPQLHDDEPAKTGRGCPLPHPDTLPE